MHLIYNKRVNIFLILAVIVLLFSGCSISKESESMDDYVKNINNIADTYNYRIENISNNGKSYSSQLINNTQTINISIELHNEKQFDYFEINCDNPIDLDEILAIVNNISRKKFSDKKVKNLLESTDKFYNVDEEHIDNDLYNFIRVDYLGMSADYCVQYYSLNANSTVLSFSGFTK